MLHYCNQKEGKKMIRLELHDTFFTGTHLHIGYYDKKDEDALADDDLFKPEMIKTVLLTMSEVEDLVHPEDLQHEVPVSFNPFNDNIEYAVIKIRLWDYVMERQVDIAETWLDREEARINHEKSAA